MTVPGTASELVAAVEATSPDVVRLATLVSVAARIEPGLLRCARLTLAADLPTASEARLWFSPLVAARTSSAIALDPEVAAVLRERLAASPELRSRVLDVVEWAHRDKVPPTIQLEEDVIRAAITGAGEAALSALLARALATMAQPGRAQGIARWAARAVPGLPALARDSSAGHLLMAGASARLRLPVPIEPDAGPAADLASVIPPDSPHIDVGLRLLRQGLEISEPPAPTALAFSVPDTDPVVLRVRQASGDDAERVLTVRRGTVERHRLGASPFTPPGSYEVTAVDGQVARLEPAATVLESQEAPDRDTQPPAVDAPQSLTEMIELVRRAEAAGTTVHALTARRDAGFEPMSYLGESTLFRGRLELDDGTLATRSEGLVRVLAGTPLEDLCADLHRSGVALATMPSDTAQTVGELIGSSAHGSGFHPPFCDLVRSLDVVGSWGDVIRIEPRDGLTDPERFAARYADSRRLMQDDETFWAAVCGLGAIGLVHSVVLDVVPQYQLRRTASLTTWEELRESRLTEELLRTARHVEIALDPYARPDGRHVALLTRVEPVEVDPRRDVSPPRETLTQRLLLAPSAKLSLRLAARFAPGALARSLPRELRRLPGDYVGWWHVVLADPLAGRLPVVSSELAIGTDEGRALYVVDEVLETAAALRTEQNLIHTAPIVLRFSGPSRAFASMMYGRPTMAIEIPLIEGTRSGSSLLDLHARGLERFGARPHWAKHARTIEPHVLYPRWEDWLRVEGTINESGACDSPLTERLGIRRRRGRSDQTLA